MTLNRRDFIQNITLTAGAALLSAGGAFPAHASPAEVAKAQARVLPQKSRQVPGVYKTTVGTIEVTAILDGGMEFSHDLFPSVPKGGIEAAQKAAFQPEGPVKAYLNTFVIRDGKRTILVDTGGGAAMGDSVGRLQRNLSAANIKPFEINEIYLTHGHIDHVSGLVDTSGHEMFAKAQIRISEAELAFWYDDAMREKAPEGKKGLFAAARKALDPYKNKLRIETFKPSADLGGGITVVDLPGHTPGHSGFRISQGSEQLLIWGDIIHAPVLQFANPDWSIAFDTDAAMAEKTRSKILAEVAADRVRIAGMHHVFPAFGHVAKAAKGYDFVPQIWEL
jgi:glyoxylase-like metal-dependent hydrolase (beta-lactamase superfamily II)